MKQLDDRPLEAVAKDTLPLTIRDEKGYMLIRSKCSTCKTCWIYMGGPGAGTCLYGGPFAGYEKVKESSELEEATKDNR